MACFSTLFRLPASMNRTNPAALLPVLPQNRWLRVLHSWKNHAKLISLNTPQVILSDGSGGESLVMSLRSRKKEQFRKSVLLNYSALRAETLCKVRAIKPFLEWQKTDSIGNIHHMELQGLVSNWDLIYRLNIREKTKSKSPNPLFVLQNTWLQDIGPQSARVYHL